MKHILFSLFALTICHGAWGQFFTEDFESGGPTWLSSGTLTPNEWRTSTCAGNGSTLPGSTALYISKGGAQPGCGLDGVDQFAYENSGAGSESLIRYVFVSANCFTSMTLSLDYLVDGDANDFAEIVISTDAVSWTVLGAPLFDAAVWTTSSLAIPASFDNSNFYIGVRFTYDNTIVDGAPLAVDNLLISGTDTAAPNIICPSAQTIYAGTGSCDVLLPDFTGMASVSDFCGDVSATVTQSIPPGTAMLVATSPYSITLTATDGAGNSNQCAFNLNVLDTVPPVISCPSGPFSAFLDANCELLVPDYSSVIGYTENCETQFGIGALTQSPPAGTIVGASTTINFTITDNFGNAASCGFTMNAIDTISPTISCPADFSVATNNGCGVNVLDYTSLASPSDNCTFTGSILVTQTPAPGTLLSAGANTINLQATDASGNTGNCSFVLTVEDNEAPVISTCASNQTVYSDANCEGILGDYTNLITAFDNCTATMNLVVTQSPLAGTPITGTTLVTITVADENMNSTNCQFSTFLTDTLSPVVICPANFSVSTNSSCAYLIPDLSGNVSGTDNCSTFANMTVSQSPVAGATGSGLTNVTVQLLDEQGNTATCIVQIAPIDTIAPTITCPNPAPINNGNLCDFTLGYYGSTASVLDNCPNYTITQSPPSGTIVPVGNTPITITVIDAGGNQAACTFDLNVFETELPSIVCPSDTATCDPVVFYTQPTFADNCLASMTQTDLTGLNSGSTFPIGTTTLEYTAIDSSSNTRTCSFTIEILEYPDAAIIIEDTLAFCNQSSALIEAESIASGAGEWTVSSGSGAFNNQFANSTGVNGIGQGTNVYVWTVSSPSCGSSSDSLVVINALIDLPANTQDTVLACTSPTAALFGNSPLYGSGQWTTNSNAVIASSGSASTSADLFDNGWYEFVWTISNIGCPSTSDTLHILSLRKPEIDQADTSICIDGEAFSLSVGNYAPGQTILWTSTNTSIDFSAANSPQTEAYNLSDNSNLIVCSMSYPGCTSTYDTIQIIGSICNGFDPVIPTVITPGNLDGKNDVFIVDNLDNLYPACTVIIVNRWGSIVYESTGYSEPWNGTFEGKLLPMGTYFYKISLNDDDQQIITGDISIIN